MLTSKIANTNMLIKCMRVLHVCYSIKTTDRVLKELFDVYSRERVAWRAEREEFMGFL
jgi:hypothetical protein